MKQNKSVIIKRLTATTNVNVKDWQEIETIEGMFLPLSDERQQIAQAEGIIGQAYNLYVAVGTDIQATDRLEIDSKTYDVRGVQKFEGSQSVDHIKLLLEEAKE